MIEFPLVFAAGILGTAHCLGMCGPLALAIGGSSSGWLSAVGRQGAYTTGRVFTYGVLGAVAGYCGSRVVNVIPTVVNVPAILAIVAGLLLIYQGLHAAGWLPYDMGSHWRKRSSTMGHDSSRKQLPISAAPCLAGGMFGSLLRQPGGSGALLAGIFTGLLPCGLLYGMLALATSTHSLLLGGATMAVFGLGTAPVMVLAGLSGRLMSLAARRWLFAAAAWCLVLTGAISIARGVSFLTIAGTAAAGCPLCTQ